MRFRLEKPSVMAIVAMIGWWTIYALVFASQVMSMEADRGNPVRWAEALKYSFGGWLTWIPVSLVIYWMVKRYPIERGRLFFSATALLALVVCIVVAKAAYIYATNPFFGWYVALPAFKDVVFKSFLNNFMLGWTVVGIAHAFVFYAKARERERQIAEVERSLVTSQLAALRARLNPHFLFNAMNSVAEMVHVNPDVADRMLISLSVMMREGLKEEKAQERELREEVALVEHYLTIEKIRLSERLSVEWSLTDESLDVLVPVLMLQPLVENAIVHGISRRRAPGFLRITSGVRDGSLIVLIENSVGDKGSYKSGNGVGIKNAADRLTLLYGTKASLVQHDEVDGIYAVELRLPAVLSVKPWDSFERVERLSA